MLDHLMALLLGATWGLVITALVKYVWFDRKTITLIIKKDKEGR
jgi:hypothetical protein